MEGHLKSTPLELGNFTVKQKQSDRYLGQILHSEGTQASVAATIADYQERINGAIFEVKSIVEEFEMQAIGGMMSAWELWEKALLPSLLSGAGTWVGSTSKEEERCDKIQEFFWRVMLQVPESCPRVALRAETKMIRMKQRIWQMKLLLLKRIHRHRHFVGKHWKNRKTEIGRDFQAKERIYVKN